MFGRFFRPVPTWDMDRAREYMDEHAVGEYQLVDVRTDEEFSQGHVPGAISIPLHELNQRIDELDPARLTLVHCLSGGRAGNAAMVMTEAGFEQVYNIGGIREWRGLVASGTPQAGMAWFDPAEAPEHYVALAWAMEDGAVRFYEALADRFAGEGMQETFIGMSKSEVHHAIILAKKWRELTGRDGDPELPEADLSDVMEGGVSISEALTWAQGANLTDVLEFLIGVEANAYDRYMRLARCLPPEIQEIFRSLGKAEKAHQDELVDLFLRSRRTA